jgi:hypothetical protein
MGGWPTLSRFSVDEHAQLDDTTPVRQRRGTGLAFPAGRVAHPFVFFLLTKAHGWMIPLQHVNAEGLVWLLRVPHPF